MPFHQLRITWCIGMDSNHRAFYRTGLQPVAFNHSATDTLTLDRVRPVTATIYLLAVRNYGYPSALAFVDRFRIHALRIPPKGSGTYIHPDLIPSTVCQRCRKSSLLQFSPSLPVLIICRSFATTVDAMY